MKKELLAVCLLLWGFGKARDPLQSSGPSGLNLLASAHRGLPAPGYQKYWPIRAGTLAIPAFSHKSPAFGKSPRIKAHMSLPVTDRSLPYGRGSDGGSDGGTDGRCVRERLFFNCARNLLPHGRLNCTSEVSSTPQGTHDDPPHVTAPRPHEVTTKTRPAGEACATRIRHGCHDLPWIGARQDCLPWRAHFFWAVAGGQWSVVSGHKPSSGTSINNFYHRTRSG